MVDTHAHIETRADSSIDPAVLNGLTEAVGWGRRSAEKWVEILSRSKYLCSLWIQDRLVGFGRVLEDGTMAMFYDIAVHPEFQGQGLGTKIMVQLLSQLQGKDYVSVGLFAWDKNPKSIRFYERFGFNQVVYGMKLSKMAPDHIVGSR